MRLPSPSIGHLVLATVALGLMASPISAQESSGLAAAGTGRLRPQIVGRESAEDARTYGTTSTTVLTLNSYFFSPNDSSTAYTYSPVNGGMYVTSGHPVLGHTVDLPEGALVTSIELDGCDNDNAGSLTLYFSKCSVGGPCTDLTAVGTLTADTPGCGRFPLTLSSPVTIDNLNNSYFTYVIPEGGDNAAFHAVRIYYKLQVSPAPATATFADVPTSHTYFRAIEALAASGITSGCGGGNFCPSQTVTRGELAKFLANALGLHHAP